ncbi:MAG TPA: hypothetical protein VFY05_04770 [Candidatus Angelobacter sp.]|nr:hypothetical protein [Candidatus Angelobacter sp.]
MNDSTTTINKLKEVQADLRKAADGIDTLIELANRPLLDLTSSALAGTNNRLSQAARSKIAEANKNFWIKCERPECKGVRHRKTHPHIVQQLKKTRAS